MTTKKQTQQQQQQHLLPKKTQKTTKNQTKPNPKCTSWVQKYVTVMLYDLLPGSIFPVVCLGLPQKKEASIAGSEKGRCSAQSSGMM